MKKFRKGIRWKNLLKKRSKKSIKRRKRIRKLKKRLNQIKRNNVRIDAPKSLSFLLNLAETVAFFQQIEKRISIGTNIYLDLSKIESLTGDAILYLLSIANRTKLLEGKGSIQGNVPENDEARKYLEASGFYKYVRSSSTFIPINQNFFAIRRGVLVDPTTLKEAIMFSIEKSRNNSTIKSFLKNDIYRSLNEATGNVAQHAYSKNGLDRYWWLMVEFLEEKSKLRFYVLDNGLGISETIAKKIKERIFDLLIELFINHTDADYLLSALKGEFRSATKKKYRGFGLPEIRSIAENKHIAEFYILSNYGFVDVKKMKPTKLSSKIQGTLLIWEIQL